MRWRFLLLLVMAVGLGVEALVGAYAVAAVPAWTTYRHDAARSGIDPDSTRAVAPSQAWQTPALDGQVYGQPLVYGRYLYVATENDSVYKLDAATGAVVWSAHLATPEPSSMAPCGDISPSIGVTSTPVIDPATGRIYVVGAVLASGAVQHELFAVDLSSGRLVAGFPMMVDPPYPGGGAAVNQLQRAGLALDGGRILVGYGGNDGDCSTYWGWLVSVPIDGTTGRGYFQVDASHTEGAIWASGNAPTVDAAGDVFVATGNGNGNSTSDPEYGESVVRLNASASPLDWWAPPNWQSLDSSDADLGSGMPTLLPGGLLFQSGKDGNGYLLNGADLGHVGAAAAETPGFCPGGSFGGSVYDPANSTIYAACADGLRALALGSGSPPSLAAKAGFSAPSSASGPPTIAGGLVWVTSYSSGTLYGLDPTSGATRSQSPIPENGSDVNHFASPSAGGGRLFVASGDQVSAYTIAQPPASIPTITRRLRRHRRLRHVHARPRRPRAAQRPCATAPRQARHRRRIRRRSPPRRSHCQRSNRRRHNHRPLPLRRAPRIHPRFKLVLVTNHRPRIVGDDDAIWRRLQLVPFEQSFEGREDRLLEAKLGAELPGGLTWAVVGCLDWQHNGLGQAGAIARATSEYRQDEDIVSAFLAERCIMTKETPTDEVRSAYTPGRNDIILSRSSTKDPPGRRPSMPRRGS